jgi:transglutaminase-like putative cysteine protease
MLLRVTHKTHYDYNPAVETAQHLAHLQPRATPAQEVLNRQLTITPIPVWQTVRQDIFGNTQTFFALQGSLQALTVLATSEVRTREHRMPAVSSLSWELAVDSFRFRKNAICDLAAEFTFASPHVPKHDDFLTYARPSFQPQAPLVSAVTDLMNRIHQDFAYVSDSTDINTPARDALASRHGVCQDFAHVMLACLRTLGLPARYISGYVLTTPPAGQPRLIGSDAAHAWVSVYLPNAQGLGGATDGIWIDFDPTNNRCGLGSPGEDYVMLAMGRDFSDVSPIRGVIHGGSHHTLNVAVTVEPLHHDSAF